MKDERKSPLPHGDESGQSPTRKQEDGPGMERTLDRSQNMDRDINNDPHMENDPHREESKINADPDRDKADKEKDPYSGPRREEDLVNEREREREERRKNDPDYDEGEDREIHPELGDDPRDYPLEGPPPPDGHPQ